MLLKIITILKDVETSLKTISKSLSVLQTSREYIIKNSRDVVILCSQAIISAHNGDMQLAKNKIKRARKLLVRYKQKIKYNFLFHIITAEQELVEADSLLSIIEKKEIKSIKYLDVSSDAYVLGLLDCIGELKRLIYDKIRIGKPSDAIAIFKIMEELYLKLYPFTRYDKIIKEVRRKIDINRIIIEDTRSAITEEIRRSHLIDIIKKLEQL